MYLQCKHGFIEADRWDGTPIPIETHMRAIKKLVGGVIVLRSRRFKTLQKLNKSIRRNVRIWKSPKGWDYEFRSYVTMNEFTLILMDAVFDIDYRNFKNWTHSHDKDHAELALDVWHAAHKMAVTP